MNETMMTMRYFDLFDYPLKKDEVFKWHFGKSEVGLDELLAKQLVEERDGYYFLAFRNDIIKTRKAREIISLKNNIGGKSYALLNIFFFFFEIFLMTHSILFGAAVISVSAAGLLDFLLCCD